MRVCGFSSGFGCVLGCFLVLCVLLGCFAALLRFLGILLDTVVLGVFWCFAGFGYAGLMGLSGLVGLAGLFGFPDSF